MWIRSFKCVDSSIRACGLAYAIIQGRGFKYSSTWIRTLEHVNSRYKFKDKDGCRISTRMWMILILSWRNIVAGGQKGGEWDGIYVIWIVLVVSTEVLFRGRGQRRGGAERREEGSEITSPNKYNIPSSRRIFVKHTGRWDSIN
jgi:hypothetical protein